MARRGRVANKQRLPHRLGLGMVVGGWQGVGGRRPTLTSLPLAAILPTTTPRREDG